MVAANTASQKLIEDQHNLRLDSIAANQQKVERYSVSMATIKELYKLSMQNISGFGTESRYYKEIGLCAFDILKDVPELIKTVNGAKFTNKQHNLRLDSIAAKQQKVELYSVSMATIKELYKLSMQNISGFGTESRY